MTIYKEKQLVYDKTGSEIDFIYGVAQEKLYRYAEEGRMNRKIVFLDIDGTLTESGSNRPPGSALRAVRQARTRGHLVFLCSGRNYAMLSPLLDYGFDGVAASAGGYVECGGEIIFDCPMTEEQRLRALKVFADNGVFRTVECRDASYTDESFQEYLREHITEGRNRELLRKRVALEEALRMLPMRQYREEPVYKVVFMSPCQERLVKPWEMLKEDFTFWMQEEKGDCFISGELMNRKFHKGQAVERVCRHLGIDRCDSLAFGDSMNDREMLETAGCGICMGNGSPALKELADDVCPPVGKEGLYRAFLKYGLITDGE